MLLGSNKVIRESCKIKLEYPYSELYDNAYTYDNQEHGFTILYLKKNEETCYDKWIAYARYLMSVKLARFLTTEERVYHKDGDKFNNNIDNLELKTDIKNKPKPCKSHYIEIKCSYCGKSFIRKSQLVHQHNNYCSPDCIAKNDHRRNIIKNKQLAPKHIVSNKVKVQYFHNDSLLPLEGPFKEVYESAYTTYDKEYGRVVHLKPKTSTTFSVTMNYYRYLLSIKLNRILSRNERVIYLDKDPTNKSLDNMTVKNHG